MFYESVIRSASMKFPKSTIFSILESSQRDYTDKIKTIQQICEYYGVITIDTIQGFAESGQPYEELCDDGTHPNAAGQQINYLKAKEAIESCFSDGEFVTKVLINKHILYANSLRSGENP